MTEESNSPLGVKIDVTIQTSDDSDTIRKATKCALEAAQKCSESEITEDKDVYVDLGDGDYIRYTQKEKKNIWMKIKDFFNRIKDK